MPVGGIAGLSVALMRWRDPSQGNPRCCNAVLGRRAATAFSAAPHAALMAGLAAAAPPAVASARYCRSCLGQANGAARRLGRQAEAEAEANHGVGTAIGRMLPSAAPTTLTMFGR